MRRYGARDCILQGREGPFDLTVTARFDIICAMTELSVKITESDGRLDFKVEVSSDETSTEMEKDTAMHFSSEINKRLQVAAQASSFRKDAKPAKNFF